MKTEGESSPAPYRGGTKRIVKKGGRERKGKSMRGKR